MQNIEELKRQGLSICAIAAMTGFDRKTIRRYLDDPGATPRFGPRPKRAGKLEPFKGYIEERLGAGVWNAAVLLRELREREYQGGYAILKDFLQPTREAARAVAVRRFETPPPTAGFPQFPQSLGKGTTQRALSTFPQLRHG